VSRESLTELQLRVMKALWQVGEGTLGDISSALSEDGKALAPTTVATLLQRLSKQGWVKHRREGRQFMYRAGVGERETARGALQGVLASFFGGKVSALTAQLLESEPIAPEELEALRRLLREKGG
jgi:predicted transcriptional regulator